MFGVPVGLVAVELLVTDRETGLLPRPYRTARGKRSGYFGRNSVATRKTHRAARQQNP
jgi:hypothetical protein